MYRKKTIRQDYGFLMSRIEEKYQHLSVPEDVMHLYRLATLIHYGSFEDYYSLYGWQDLSEVLVDDAKRSLLGCGLTQFERDTLRLLTERCAEQERSAKPLPNSKVTYLPVPQNAPDIFLMKGQ